MELEIREASKEDLELMMAWRSNPLVYKGFYIQDEPLEWEGHLSWWKSRENRKDWIIEVGEDGEKRDVGNVNVSDLDTDSPEVGVYVGEVTLWGKGVGKKAVELTLDWLKENGYEEAKANILDDNERSIALFKELGFKRKGSGRENESVYMIEL